MFQVSYSHYTPVHFVTFERAFRSKFPSVGWSARLASWKTYYSRCLRFRVSGLGFQIGCRRSLPAVFHCFGLTVTAAVLAWVVV